MTSMVEMLVSMGGREWTGGANHRVYLPIALCCEVIGLCVVRYDSGNVRAAKFNGEKISNREAADILEGLSDCYYDVAANKFRSVYGVGPALRARLAVAVAS